MAGKLAFERRHPWLYPRIAFPSRGGTSAAPMTASPPPMCRSVRTVISPNCPTGPAPTAGTTAAVWSPCPRSARKGPVMLKIAVDAMGGDKAPQAIVSGAVEAARRSNGRFEVVLVGEMRRPLRPSSTTITSSKTCRCRWFTPLSRWTWGSRLRRPLRPKAGFVHCRGRQTATRRARWMPLSALGTPAR